MIDQRFSGTVCNKIAKTDIYYEFYDHFQGTFFVLESEIFVEEIAYDTSDDIVGGRGNPIAEAYDVVGQEHDGGSYEGVDHADNEEFDGGFIY